jgi:hypothetical protein
MTMMMSITFILLHPLLGVPFGGYFEQQLKPAAL